MRHFRICPSLFSPAKLLVPHVHIVQYTGDGHLPHSISSLGEFSCHYAVPTNCIKEEVLRLLNDYKKQDSRHAKSFTTFSLWRSLLVHCGQILQKNPCKGQSPPVSGNARILGAYGQPTHPLPLLLKEPNHQMRKQIERGERNGEFPTSLT